MISWHYLLAEFQGFKFLNNLLYFIVIEDSRLVLSFMLICFLEWEIKGSITSSGEEIVSNPQTVPHHLLTLSLFFSGLWSPPRVTGWVSKTTIMGNACDHQESCHFPPHLQYEPRHKCLKCPITKRLIDGFFCTKLLAVTAAEEVRVHPGAMTIPAGNSCGGERPAPLPSEGQRTYVCLNPSCHTRDSSKTRWQKTGFAFGPKVTV